MSGPKQDQAELERQRKAELERQRQEKLRKIREETEKLNTEIFLAKEQINNIDKHLHSEIRNIGDAEEMASIIKKLHELKTLCKHQLTNALGIDVPTEPGAIFACAQNLARVTNSIMANYFNEVKPLEERILDYNRQLEIQNKLNSIKFSSEREKIKNIEDFDFTIKLDNVAQSNIEQSVKERAEQILSEIEKLVNSESIQESDMKDLLVIANNIYKTAFETNNSFEAATIEYKVARPQVVRNMAIFDDIYQDYYAEYVTYLELLNSHKTTPVKIVPKRKYRFGSIDELQNEMTLLAESSKAMSEKKYIREQIDDVMQKFGYDMSSEIIFDLKHTGSHYICENKSKQSAIHVYLSEKKQIMMEIVGVGKSTGVANTNSATATMIQSSDLNAQEKDMLLGEQVNFCKLHPQIVDELKKRGVILSEKKRNAPSLEYCSKIIRISDDDAIMNKSSLVNDEYDYNEYITKRERLKKQGTASRPKKMESKF